MDISKELLDIISEACAEHNVRLLTDYFDQDPFKTCLAMIGPWYRTKHALRQITESVLEISRMRDEEEEGLGAEIRHQWMAMAFDFSLNRVAVDCIFWPFVKAPAK